ncbi:MAG TPA: gephyrin-like molybdotransferase Glp [Terriglobales bacterium]|nr:gephyrin-like molybdotransferase Glp [Terriglobales bacterium]
MPSLNDARDLVLRNVTVLGSERVPLLDAVGRVLAEDVVAPWDMPFCDNSAMDGFAVRMADCNDSLPLKVIGYVPAGGTTDAPVQPGCAVKIMTGAPLPAGCEAVVPVEDTEEAGGFINLKARVLPRQHMRFTGEDVKRGEVVLAAGAVVGPPQVSMIASFGRAFVSVHRAPRVAILSTGDELVEVGEPLAPGKVINSNTLSLAAAVKQLGAIPVMLGIARDNRECHREKMAEGLKADVLITSAGVSAGDRDMVRGVLADLGVEQVFWRVDIKPGGPMTFGKKDEVPVFCLPGNPVATMITFEEFVRPALLKMMGHTRVLKPLLNASLQEEVRKKPGKIKFLRVKLRSENGRYLAYSSGDQNTGMLKTMLLADGIALLPADRTSFAPGDEIAVHLLADYTYLQES